MTQPIRIKRQIVEATIRTLRSAGLQRRECVVLWLAKKSAAGTEITEVYMPDQFAKEDVFRIPPIGMKKLMEHLEVRGCHIFAQVHSHPKEAFHSKADDTWAIVRHIGAISIVVPHFAKEVTTESFFAKSAFFQLDRNNRWILSDPKKVMVLT